MSSFEPRTRRRRARFAFAPIQGRDERWYARQRAVRHRELGPDIRRYLKHLETTAPVEFREVRAAVDKRIRAAAERRGVEPHELPPPVSLNQAVNAVKAFPRETISLMASKTRPRRIDHAPRLRCARPIRRLRCRRRRPGLRRPRSRSPGGGDSDPAEPAGEVSGGRSDPKLHVERDHSGRHGATERLAA
jgi:hypothetical protein